MCGIVGVFNHPQAAVLSYYALHALQHRGQEASGIVTMYHDGAKNKKRFGVHKGEGLVLDVFSEHDVFTKTLRGEAAIGHNRYSTTGSNSLANIQPFHFNYTGGNFALAHNGNLTSGRSLRAKMKDDGFVGVFRDTKRDAAKQKQMTALEEHWGKEARQNYERAAELAKKAAALAR